MVRFRTNGRPLDGAGCAAIYLCVRNDLDLYLGPFASGGRCDCQSPSLIHDHISAGPLFVGPRSSSRSRWRSLGCSSMKVFRRLEFVFGHNPGPSCLAIFSSEFQTRLPSTPELTSLLNWHDSSWTCDKITPTFEDCGPNWFWNHSPHHQSCCRVEPTNKWRRRK